MMSLFCFMLAYSSCREDDFEQQNTTFDENLRLDNGDACCEYQALEKAFCFNAGLHNIASLSPSEFTCFTPINPIHIRVDAQCCADNPGTACCIGVGGLGAEFEPIEGTFRHTDFKATRADGSVFFVSDNDYWYQTQYADAEPVTPELALLYKVSDLLAANVTDLSQYRLRLDGLANVSMSNGTLAIEPLEGIHVNTEGIYTYGLFSKHSCEYILANMVGRYHDKLKVLGIEGPPEGTGYPYDIENILERAIVHCGWDCTELTDTYTRGCADPLCVFEYLFTNQSGTGGYYINFDGQGNRMDAIRVLLATALGIDITETEFLVENETLADILLNQILASNNGACSGMSRDEGLCSTFGLVDYITTNIINSAHQDFEANYFTSIFNAYGNPVCDANDFQNALTAFIQTLPDGTYSGQAISDDCQLNPLILKPAIDPGLDPDNCTPAMFIGLKNLSFEIDGINCTIANLVVRLDRDYYCPYDDAYARAQMAEDVASAINCAYLLTKDIINSPENNITIQDCDESVFQYDFTGPLNGSINKNFTPDGKPEEYTLKPLLNRAIEKCLNDRVKIYIDDSWCQGINYNCIRYRYKPTVYFDGANFEESPIYAFMEWVNFQTSSNCP
ncbi:MAG: hypothetical protein H6554_08480 [Chitinophagales bacterium]|nr:hypothetical protein [Chitinophagales bacterium]